MKRSKKFFVALFIITLGTLSFPDTTYKVQKGDTLFSISKKNQITINELRVANNLGSNDMIRAGQTLIIPKSDIMAAAALNTNAASPTAPSSVQKATTKEKSPAATKSMTKANIKTKSYTVQKGDTLYGIARKNGVNISVLLNLNNIDLNSTIKSGQKILVPLEASQRAAQRALAQDKENAKKERLASSKGILWPLENPRVKPIQGKTGGVELTGRDKESVLSVREGTVMFTGVYRGFGQVVFVQSKTGLIYSYSGLKQVDAKKGDYVTMGSPLGTLGQGGDTSIKFMVFQNGEPLDPVAAPRG